MACVQGEGCILRRKKVRPSQDQVYAEVQMELRGAGESIPNGICGLHDRLASAESREPGGGD